jgi:hypothetical protein
MIPRHALSSIMVWNTGVGPWWAATAVKMFKLSLLCSTIMHPASIEL